MILFSCKNETKNNKQVQNLNTSTIESFKFYTKKDRINWEKFETKVSDVERKKWAKEIFKDFAYFGNIDSINLNSNVLFEKHLHFIDINADNKLDVIFEGWSGAEGEAISIYINNSGRLKRFFYGTQYIENLNFSTDGKLTTFTILDFGCCAEYLESKTKYLIGKNFKTSIIWQRIKTSFTYRPKTIFSKPINLQR